MISKNIKKWFVVSDIHSDYLDLKFSLRIAGFNKRNKEHGLIVIGDVFDRFPETISVYKYLSSIPKSRCILIKGNHELLFRDLLNKKYPDTYDFSNRTANTFFDIAHRDIKDLYTGAVKWKEVTDYVKCSKVWAWLNSEQWVNYYELGPFIFTHSFIPLQIKDEYKSALYMYEPWELSGKAFNYRPDWRDAKSYDWEVAMWGDPIEYYRAGLFDEEAKKGKILVVGHWHASDFWLRLANIQSYESVITDIYRDEHLIAIDCGIYKTRGITTTLYHPQNVLVIDAETYKCYDKYGEELKVVKPVPIRETVTINKGE